MILNIYLALKFVSRFTSTLMKMMELQNKTVHQNKFREMFKIILRHILNIKMAEKLCGNS